MQHLFKWYGFHAPRGHPVPDLPSINQAVEVDCHHTSVCERDREEMERTERGERGGASVKEDNGNGGDQEKGEAQEDVPPLMALNHVSKLCRSVDTSVDFYKNVLGFVLIDRPEAFDFDGAWLFNYGVGIHLLQANEDDVLPDPDYLNPMDNHISFQCEDMDAMLKRLEGRNIKFIKRSIGDDPTIDQLFFNDPDGFMIEICNCENLKLVPAGSIGSIRLPPDRHNPPIHVQKTQ